MRSFYKLITAVAFSLWGSNYGMAQLHPKEALGREIFDSFRYSNFERFYERSIFSLNEDFFKNFLLNIRNNSMRDELIKIHKMEFPENSSFDEKWNIAFTHQWRNELRHLSKYTPTIIYKDTFAPILQEASEYGIQWKTTKLLAIEALLPITWKNGRFHIKGDFDIDANGSNTRNLFLDRGLNYRLTLDKLTYSKTFMIGNASEDSDQSYNQGILGNGSGQGDILIRFDSETPAKLFYFCPDQVGAGGIILVKDFDNLNKPNQRTDILLTFSYDQPARAFQILIKDVLHTSKGAIFTERPKFLGEVPLPRGLSFHN